MAFQAESSDAEASRQAGWTRAKLALSLAAAAVVAVAIRWSELRLPFLLDDFLQQNMSSGSLWPARPAWDRYRLVSGAPDEVRRLVSIGRLPWWTAPDLRLAPFRPLSSLENALGFALYGSNATAAHAVSLAWLVALVASVGLLFRATLPWRATAAGLLVYALSPAHCVTVGWVANRCALIGGTFAVLAVRDHVRFRRDALPLARARSLLFLTVALLSAEYALGAFGFLLAYELLEARGPTRERVTALAGPALLGIAYTALFKLTGHGARSTTLYSDPLGNPAEFVSKAASNTVALLRLTFAPVPRDIFADWVGLLALANLFVIASLLFSGDRPSTRRSARWLFVGGLLSLVPVAAAWPDHRLLALPAVALAASLGAILDDALTARHLPSRVASAWLGAVFAGVTTLTTLAKVKELRIHTLYHRAALEAPLGALPDEDAVLLLSTAEVFPLHYPPIVRSLAGLPSPRAWWGLACTRNGYEVRRTADDELELRAFGASLLDDANAGVYRDLASPLPQGTVLDAGRMRATVVEVGAAGPTRVRFKFPESLDDPHLVLLTWGPQGFVRIAAPKPGEPRVVTLGG